MNRIFAPALVFALVCASGQALAKRKPLDQAAPSPPATPTSAPASCSEGRAFNGQCISPILGQMARTQAVFATQARISRAAPPVPQGLDTQFRYPNIVFGAETPLSGHHVFYTPY